MAGISKNLLKLAAIVSAVCIFGSGLLVVLYLFGPAEILHFTFPLKDYLLDEYAYCDDENTLAKLQPQSVPFIFGIENHPIVKTYIDGRERPVSLCVDTGSSFTFVGESTVSKLPIAARGKVIYGLTDKPVESSCMRLPALKLGNLSFHRALVIPVSLDSWGSGFEGVSETI